ERYFLIKGTSVGHPLITADKRVANNINIPSQGKIMLVTGSNMAGKSTYLRSVGVNCVLAFCGAPVCATEFQVSDVAIISSMRIEDNLQESTSTFYAELKKLKAIIDRVNQGERVFILLDEILRGTNSTDRHTGSKALIRQLIEKQSVAIIATHDLELAAMKDTYREHIDNYHFDVQVNGEELYFDYKLKEGICKSMNASILMKKIGIELD
ncbi:MAG TPA: DNA mismatch repair protein MutS, partial [Ginsengibacter sp.]|nr:DNA mismatch repair protein MutS [Ginsengibacter sp.]